MPEQKKAKIKARIPYLALRGLVFYPGSTMSFEVGREETIAALKEAMARDRKVLLLSQKDPLVDHPTAKDLYRVGTFATIRQVIELGFNHYKVLCTGISRAKATQFGRRKGVRVASIELLESEELAEEDALMLEAFIREVKKKFEVFAMNSGLVAPDTVAMVTSEADSHTMADLICTSLGLDLEEKQRQLEETNIIARLEHLLVLIHREIEIVEVTRGISEKVQQSVDQNQREYILREQLRSIQEELGDDEESEIDRLSEAIEQSRIPEDYKKKLRRELKRLDRMPPNFPETTVQRNWLELIVELPFGRVDEEKLDLRQAEKILNNDHYGLEKVKERILEYIAVRALQVRSGENRIKGPILCLVGPPGVGKTSIAKSIADALGRRYVRMSLGGIRDEAEIRGHRRTYVGAMPGRIIQGIRYADSDNPLFLLDEIDKLGNDFRGDPSSALLEVLDPEQNNNFRDHYVEFPYDLSQVLFITTANSAWDIPEPLLDRMELIELSGYTEEEKIQIAKRHLLPAQMKAHAIDKQHFTISQTALARLISWYTSEAGVRQLDRELARLCRRVAVKIAQDPDTKISVTVRNLEDILGRRKFNFEMAEQKPQVGMATGLAWTYAGGDTLTIEVNVLPGQGKIELTGSLGDVMKESAQAAVTYVRAQADKLGFADINISEQDIHIHVPAGAVPKDGPSAGITIATALASALSGRPVRSDLAMTGEITLRGHVMPIGGLKEKAVAAKRAGIKEILIPKENERDIEDIPESVTKQLKITLVDKAEEVFAAALLAEEEGKAKEEKEK